MSIRDVAIDLEVIERDRLRNGRERVEFLDWYIGWLRRKGVVKPPISSRPRRPRPAKQPRE